MNSISRARFIGALSGPFQAISNTSMWKIAYDIQARGSGHVALRPRRNQLQSARRYELSTRDCQSPRRDERSPFTRRIAAIPLRDQTVLCLQFYNKGDDPRGWLRNFEIVMKRQKYASPEEQDANYCQVFIEYMNKDATSWFSNLPAETIDSFDDLSTAFMKHFRMFISKGSTNLFTMA
ncbi:unnamed protein product [Microthlaspi erraticum]|uniref:Retrotransposon gag domain-containing protein n=1 Tax=Microthlaspi erraticum TaxID=1685480 RepID=A0A6D2KSI4_9BRAS|nr:unnamed protein product [Microthlaspi erraticum]